MGNYLYAPHVYRFAYHLQIEQFNYSWLQTQCQQILAEFPQLTGKPLTFRTDSPDRLIYPCLAAGKKSRVYKSEPIVSPPQRLSLSPQIVHDCQALEVVSRIYQKAGADALSVEQLGAVLNPHDCLNLNSQDDPDFIGQTLLLTAFLDASNLSDPQTLATEALAHLLHTDGDRLPEFYRSDTLFDSPLFEFGNPRFDHRNRYLVLFYRDEPSSQKFIDYLYPNLSSLLCFYHKILYVFSGAHQDYHFAQKIRENIDVNLVNILPLEDDANPINKVLSTAETQAFKQHLKQLLRDGIEYSRLSRNIEHSLNTLAINQANYQMILEQWQNTSHNPLPFFQRFLTVEAKTFQAQIQGDLTYVKLGGELLGQATNTIQGLIAIDETERDRQLQNTIAYIGAGLGAGSLFAGSYALKKSPQLVPLIDDLPVWSKADPMIKCFTYSVLVGVFVAFVVWFVLQLRQRGSPQRNN